MTTVERPQYCLFCGGEMFLHWRTASVWRCSRCDLGFRKPFPSGAELSALYRSAWVDPEAHRSETGGTDLRLARIYTRRLTTSLGTSIRGLKIIDFGAGRGAMALALSEEGADVYCVEPFGHERLEALGLRSVPSLSELPGSFRANGIVSLDVIEHLPRPWEDLKRLKGLLTSDGWLYLSTLNINSLNGSLMRSSWREARKEGHIIFFTPASLERVLKHCGWRRYRRLRWLIPYKNVALYRFMQYGLQATGLESGLRYLVWNDGRGYAVHG